MARGTRGRSLRGRESARRLFAEWVAARPDVPEPDLAALLASHPQLADALAQLASEWRAMRGALQGGRSLKSVLERPGSQGAPPAAVPLEELPPETLGELSAFASPPGRYRIDDPELAHGGMGTIHRAYDRNLRRPVVRKVLDHGPPLPRAGSEPPDARSAHEQRVLSRFLEEALVTGQLDHPGIVPVHELGVTEEGRAYFTMKLVEGRDLKHILETLDSAEGWTLNRVVGVLRRICEAVAYAHSRGVLHRDIKPANIMVGRFGEAYLVDWGLARVGDEAEPAMLRATSRPSRAPQAVEADACLYTVDGDVLGTPMFMSPEQARGDVHEIDERSDIYSLGCILYQAITRRMPFVDPAEARTPDAYEVLYRVRNGPPPRVTELAPDAPPGLVEICERAMNRDPGARYATADAMAVALADYLESISKDREEARRQAQRAGKINAFLMDMLGSADPARSRGHEVTVKEVIEQAARRVERSDEQLDPLDRATLHGTLGNLFNKLGLPERAESHLLRALALHGELLGDEHPSTLAVAVDLGVVLRREGRLEESVARLRSVLAAMRRARRVDEPDGLRAMANLAFALQRLGGHHIDEAERLLTDVLVGRRTLLGERAEETLSAQSSLGQLLKDRGRPAQAEPHLRQALDGLRATVGSNHPLTLIALNDLAGVLVECGRAEEAEPLYRSSLASRREVYGDDHPETLAAMNNLAMLWRGQQRLEEAEALLRQLIERSARTPSAQAPSALNYLHNLALVLAERGREGEAEALFDQAIERARAMYGDRHRVTGRFRYNLGRCLQRQGRHARAQAELQAAHAVLASVLAPDHPWVAEAASALTG